MRIAADSAHVHAGAEATPWAYGVSCPLATYLSMTWTGCT